MADMGDDTSRILAGLVRHGIVTDTDPERRMARVKYAGGNMTSGWLYVLQHYGTPLEISADGNHYHEVGLGVTSSPKTHSTHDHNGSVLSGWMPEVNQQVLVLYLPVLNADGFILGGFG